MLAKVTHQWHFSLQNKSNVAFYKGVWQ